MTREKLLKIAKPILFNTEMVRAILDGRKTVTRRLVKIEDNRNPNWTGYIKDGLVLYNGTNEPCNKPCQYKIGDILYVRESVFQGVRHYLDVSGETVSVLTHEFEYYADGLHEKDHWKDKYERTWMHRRPSIHMPKEAARIFLKVKDVRVERLQDITEEQTEAEGATKCIEVICPGEEKPVLYEDDNGYFAIGFKAIWNFTIKKEDIETYGWDANPWVWVIEFERIKPDTEV